MPVYFLPTFIYMNTLAKSYLRKLLCLPCLLCREHNFCVYLSFDFRALQYWNELAKNCESYKHASPSLSFNHLIVLLIANLNLFLVLAF